MRTRNAKRIIARAGLAVIVQEADLFLSFRPVSPSHGSFPPNSTSSPRPAILTAMRIPIDHTEERRLTQLQHFPLLIFAHHDCTSVSSTRVGKLELAMQGHDGDEKSGDACKYGEEVHCKGVASPLSEVGRRK
jgi:hypothetical protein